MNKSKHSICLIAVIAGLILRLLYLDKPEGFWFDEMMSFQISTHKDWAGFWHAVKSQCHMPLYYIYLKLSMALFGKSDLLLRLASVIPGVVSIFIMYLTGRERDYRTGVFCAGFTAISSFLIYYSQEVRFYSLLFLFCALALLYTLRLAKVQSRKNLCLYLAANSLIVLTHTIGFVFVFFNILALSIYLRKNHKKIIAIIWTVCAAVFLLCVPLIYGVFTTQSFSQFWEKGFTTTKLMFIATDYFSPVVINRNNTPHGFRITTYFLRHAIVPAALAMFFLLKSVFSKYRISAYLLLVTLATLAVMSVAAMHGKIILLTKYTIEIYPILILLVCAGAASFRTSWGKWACNIIVAAYCIFSLQFILKSPASVLKIYKPNGHRLAANLLSEAEASLKPGDVFILLYYPRDNYRKYFNINKYRHSIIEIHKGNYRRWIMPDTSDSSYDEIFLKRENTYFADKLGAYTKDFKPGQSVVVLSLFDVMFYTRNGLCQAVETNRKGPFLFLVFSYINNQTAYELSKTFRHTSHRRRGSWMLDRFTKQ